MLILVFHQARVKVPLTMESPASSPAPPDAFLQFFDLCPALDNCECPLQPVISCLLSSTLPSLQISPTNTSLTHASMLSIHKTWKTSQKGNPNLNSNQNFKNPLNECLKLYHPHRWSDKSKKYLGKIVSMFETKPISCSTEARKCRCSILFLFNLHDLFLLKLEKIEDSLSDDSLIVFDWCLGAEITSLFRDDFVAIIQVSGFCQVPEVTGLAKMSILCPITRS